MATACSSMLKVKSQVENISFSLSLFLEKGRTTSSIRLTELVWNAILTDIIFVGQTQLWGRNGERGLCGASGAPSVTSSLRD